MGTVTNITEAIAKRDQKVVFERGDHVELADKLVESLTRFGSSTAVHADGQVWQYDEQEHVYSAIEPRALRRSGSPICRCHGAFRQKFQTFED